MVLKLYGVPLSQPVRSVAWTMLQLGVPFEFSMAVPGMKTKIGTQNPLFQALTSWKSSNVPVLTIHRQGASPLALSESPAIMTYLCERYGESSSSQGTSLHIPPPGSDAKALQDVYMHWHHANTRMVAKLFAKKVRPDLKDSKHEDAGFQQQLHEILTNIDQGWLGGDGSITNGNVGYIGGSSRPTIADILAYGELSTVTVTKLLSLDGHKTPTRGESVSYPNIASWMNQMSSLPYHDDVHVALTALGDLSDDNDENNSPAQIGKRLGAATKAGVKALADVQLSDEFQQRRMEL